MKRSWIARLWLVIADLALLEFLFYATYHWRFRSGLFLNPVPFAIEELFVPSLIVSAYWIFLLVWFGLYRFDPLHSRLIVARRSLDAAGVGILILFILTFDPGRPLPASRVVLICYGIGVCAIVAGNRVSLLTLLRALRIRGIGTMRTLLVGAGSRAQDILRHLLRHPELGLRIIGQVSDLRRDADPLLQLPRLGSFSQLTSLLRTGRFDAVVMTLRVDQEVTLFRLIRLLQPLRIRIFVPADLYSPLIGQVRPTRVHGHPLIDIRPELLSIAERALKRVTDIVVSILLLIVTLPLCILIAIAIVLDSRGPVFYVQTRVGWRGRLFNLYKFRSMVKDAEAQTGAVLASAGDPRITRVGRILRSLRLDELPQLLNVLLGQMSLVGPRPERAEFVERFVRDIPLYARRLNVKPGITGWSQVHLKYDSGADQIPVKLKYDFYYIENMSLPLDLKILFMTLFVVLRGEGR